MERRIVREMKKIIIVFCAIACSVLLESCQSDQQKEEAIAFVNINDVVVSGTVDLAEEQQSGDALVAQIDDAQYSGDLSDVQRDSVQQNGDTLDVQENNAQQIGTIKSSAQNSSSTQNSTEMRPLMAGHVGIIGAGWLVYTVPVQTDEDYKLYFFKVEDLSKDWDEVKLNLEKADYVFPDVRKNNVSIGQFCEIYLQEFIDITGSGTKELVVIASYEIDGKKCYDTRIYQVDQNGYSVNTELMQELNEKYCDVAEYPVDELYHY